MRTIKLTQGKVALVDNEDFSYLSQWSWCYNKGYAVRSLNPGKVRMHRLINNTPDGFVTDHIDHNKLNNQRINLRTANSSQNISNSKIHKDNVHGFKGIVWSGLRNKWKARIIVNRKEIHLGLFQTKKEAAEAYNKGAVKYFSNFAFLNQI